PLAMLIYGSFKSTPPGLPGDFTLANYSALLRRPEMIASIKNSLFFGLGTSCIAFIGGVYLAWVTERTNMPLKKAVYGSILVPLIVPGLLMTIGWIMLFSRRSGLINLVARNVFGVEQPLEIYNLPGMIWVLGTDQIPLAFLLLSASFRSMDPALEEAAVVSGTGIVRTTFGITLRILLPAILAVWMISFVRAIENFEVPALVGVPAGILVFATRVYLATHKVPTDFGLASTFAVVYLLITGIGIWFYLKATKVSEQFTTISGKGYRPVAFDLGRWRYPLAAVTIVLSFVLFVLPVLTVIWSSF